MQDDFVDNARLLVFEAYCRIHQCIDLRMLAAKLNMDESAAEKWVVNLIRNADLNAKINSQARLKVSHSCVVPLARPMRDALSVTANHLYNIRVLDE